MSDNYAFRVPFASSIYPQIKPSLIETLSLLRSLNASRSPSNRLPPEIQLQIQQEVHPSNAVYEDLRSTWSAIIDFEDESWDSLTNYSMHGFTDDNTDHYLPLAVAKFDPNTKKYQLPKGPLTPEDRYSTQNQISSNFYDHISSADLLYRLRCFFPELSVVSHGPDGYKSVWATGIHHNPTGFTLAFSEWKGGASLQAGITPRTAPDGQRRSAFSFPSLSLAGMASASPAYLDMLKAFSTDSINFINLISETVADGSPRLVYFHPAADADVSASDVEGYIAVPPMLQDRKRGSSKPYIRWRPVKVSATDLSPLSSFHSLLPDLKYDIALRKIDTENGQTPLTSVISSSLLFYRLLCHYCLKKHGNADSGVPITSVWQVGLRHTKTDARVILMDDHGLFDIRADENAKEVIDDIIFLVDALCSDECVHPYDGTVAGCVA